MNYRLITNKNGVTPEIKHFGDLEWSDNLDNFTSDMSFKSPEVIDIGAQVALLSGNKEIFRGVVFDRDYDKNKIYSYMVFDFAYYLGKNELIIQFNGCTISEAIIQTLRKVNIEVGDIVEIPACVKKIYKDVVVSDIIKDLLAMATKKTGIDYILRVKGRQIYVEKFEKIEVSPTYNLNGTQIKITENIGNFRAVDSILEMKNSIIINDNKESSTYLLAQANNETSIKKYGKLSVVEQPDEDDKTSKQTIANNLLNKLNKITCTRSVDLLGSDEIKKGIILSFNYPEYGFVGQHLVTSTHHTVDNVMHKVSVELETYNEALE